MKKTLSIILSALLALSAVSFTACGSDDSGDDVYVTVTNGSIVLAYDDIDLRDADGDNALTVNDALYLAHEENFKGGAAAGYASEMTDYGLSLTKLWGIDNGGAYGYTVNNVGAMSLADTVKPGDHIVAYVYTDLTAWSDTFCYFDKQYVDVEKNGEFTFELTLSANGYDESFAPITTPVEGAVITINGIATEYVTDSNGKVTVTITDDCVISAASETMTLVPPICVAEVD